LTPIVAQSERFYDVSEKNTKNNQKGGQKGPLGAFSDPGLAFGLPRPLKDLGVK